MERRAFLQSLVVLPSIGGLTRDEFRDLDGVAPHLKECKCSLCGKSGHEVEEAYLAPIYPSELLGPSVAWTRWCVNYPVDWRTYRKV